MDLVKELGGGHRALVADLSDNGQLKRVADDLEGAGYSLLVNNAGYGIYGRFGELPIDRQEHMMFVNMNALVRLSHAFLKNARAGDALKYRLLAFLGTKLLGRKMMITRMGKGSAGLKG